MNDHFRQKSDGIKWLYGNKDGQPSFGSIQKSKRSIRLILDTGAMFEISVEPEDLEDKERFTKKVLAMVDTMFKGREKGSSFVPPSQRPLSGGED